MALKKIKLIKNKINFIHNILYIFIDKFLIKLSLNLTIY